MSLPAADDLFRPTAVPEEAQPDRRATAADDRSRAESAESSQRSGSQRSDSQPSNGAEASDPGRERSSGRVRHDEKMTVYVTAEELLDLEQTRLALRRHGVAVDRGRLVREAVAIVLAEFEDRGEDSQLVRRLTGT